MRIRLTEGRAWQPSKAGEATFSASLRFYREHRAATISLGTFRRAAVTRGAEQVAVGVDEEPVGLRLAAVGPVAETIEKLLAPAARARRKLIHGAAALRRADRA